MKRNLNRTGETGGVSEAALVEAMILSARKLGVDEDVLARVLRSRKTAQERPNRSRR
jgi:3-hydroxyisobutyrate dehydrogenase-like beta-hydroxyacid dehydrogenase